MSPSDHWPESITSSISAWNRARSRGSKPIANRRIRALRMKSGTLSCEETVVIVVSRAQGVGIARCSAGRKRQSLRSAGHPLRSSCARASLSDRQDGTDFLAFEFSHDQRERLHGALVRARGRVEIRIVQEDHVAGAHVGGRPAAILAGVVNRRQSLPQRDHRSGLSPARGPRRDRRRCKGRTAAGARPPPCPPRSPRPLHRAPHPFAPLFVTSRAGAGGDSRGARPDGPGGRSRPRAPAAARPARRRGRTSP